MGWIIWGVTYLITKDSGADALALHPLFITLCFFIGGSVQRAA